MMGKREPPELRRQHGLEKQVAVELPGLIKLDQDEQDELIVVRQPAEFNTQQAIWLIWPAIDHKEGESVEKVTLLIIDALVGEENLVITCKNKELLNQAKESPSARLRR